MIKTTGPDYDQIKASFIRVHTKVGFMRLASSQFPILLFRAKLQGFLFFPSKCGYRSETRQVGFYKAAKEIFLEHLLHRIFYDWGWGTAPV